MIGANGRRGGELGGARFDDGPSYCGAMAFWCERRAAAQQANAAGIVYFRLSPASSIFVYFRWEVVAALMAHRAAPS
jgi:hypothetical protein